MNRSAKSLGLGLLLVTWFQPAWTQNAAAPRDAKAVTIVNTAITQLGGLKLWTSVKDATINGSCSSFDAARNVTSTTKIHWVQAGQEARYDSVKGSLSISYATGHGTPKMSSGNGAKAWSKTSSDAQKPYFAPGFLLSADLADPSQSFVYKGEVTLAGVETVLVRVAHRGQLHEHAGSAQDWYFDKTSGLPVQVESMIPFESNSTLGVRQTMQFQDYQSIDGSLMPHHFSTSIAALGATKIVPTDCTVDSSTLNSSPSQASFDLN